MTYLRIYARIHNAYNSVQVWWTVILRKIFVQDYIWNKEEKCRILCFETRCFRGMLQQKMCWFLKNQAKLCQVVWGIVVKNFTHKYFFNVSELLP